MPPAYRRLQLWLALGVCLVGLFAVGAMALRPDSIHKLITLPTPAATMPSPAPTASPLPAHTATATATLATATATPLPPTATAPSAPTAAPSPWPSPVPTLAPGETRLPTPDGQARSAHVPILMYHYISDPPPDADDIRLDLSVPPSRFEAQLAYLKQAGYTSITLEDLVQNLTTGRPLPPKPIILTFDDGYVDNFLYAFPLLRQYGFTGTVFVVTQFLDQGIPAYLSWEQAQLMEANGMDIEAHGVTHDDLRGQPAAWQLEQVQGARASLEQHLHQPVRFFSYPFGHYDGSTIAALRSAGFWASVTTEAGAEHSSGDLFELTRVRIHGADTLDRFQQILVYYAP